MAIFSLARTAQPALDQVLGDTALLRSLRQSRDDTSHGALGPSSIEFSDVRFHYEGTEVDVLCGISLCIEPGDDVGVVGTSGAGKSTLLDVLLGLLDPGSGEVLIGGTPMRRCRTDWQLSIGYVPQEIILIDDTIRANIAFGISGDDIEEEQLQEALRLAQLDEFVAALPEGLETTVGELGVRLSGGQRQRLGLARALYDRPTVLVLDEATSALDSDTEARIVETIASLRGSLTIVTVAHRLSTLKHCDRIYFLRDGHVANVGTFEELTAQEPDFAQLVALAQLSLSSP
jgi:ABC-type multidrug transport system fused ATPase/permease subunit